MQPWTLYQLDTRLETADKRLTTSKKDGNEEMKRRGGTYWNLFKRQCAGV